MNPATTWTRRLGLGALAGGLIVTLTPPTASAWYPEGLVMIRKCGDPVPPPDTLLTDMGEPQEGHVGPWSSRRTIYNSPSHMTTRSTQLRAITFRVERHYCEGRSLYLHTRYHRFEQRHSDIAYVKGGGSVRPLPAQPMVSDWYPFP